MGRGGGKGISGGAKREAPLALAPAAIENAVDMARASGSEVDAYFKKNGVLSWQRHLTMAERSNINDYTGSAYVRLNDYLRGTNKFYQSQDDIAWFKDMDKNIASGIAKFNTKENLTVYRGKGMSSIPAWARSDPRKLIGTIYRDAGYMSTSPTLNGAFSGVVHFEIRVPAGRGRGAYVKNISQHSSEYEYLIHSNSSSIVRDVYQTDSGNWKIVMDLIG